MDEAKKQKLEASGYTVGSAWEFVHGTPKQVIVVRKDLNMRKGKIAAQCSHASMKVVLDAMSNHIIEGKSVRVLQLAVDSPLYSWLEGRFTKVVVSIDSEAELLTLEALVTEAGILNARIVDCGATEFHGEPTLTCLAIGPEWPDKIDPFTRLLKLM